MTNRMRSTIDTAWRRLALMSVLALTIFGASGRLTAHAVNDTPSYLNYPLDSVRDAMLSIRTPGYPIFLAFIQRTVGISLVPLAHALLHLIASWLLGEELIRRRMSPVTAFTVAICVLLGCTAMDHLGTISTDAPAASLGVLTAVFLMRAQRTATAGNAALCCMMAAIAIAVRPAYLFLIPWLIIASPLLAQRQKLIQAVSLKPASPKPADATPYPSPAGPLLGLKVATGVALVVLAWMGARKAMVDDFAIAPFGHQNLSALLVQTVPPDTLRTLPGDAGLLGRRVADRLERDGFQLPTAESGMLPTMTIEDQWGQINYFVVWPIAKSMDTERRTELNGAEPVRTHRRIAALNRAILTESPRGYFRWLILAARRAVWGSVADITMHPFFLPAILLGLTALLIRVCRVSDLGPLVIPDGWGTLAIVAITYAALSTGFVILTSPPIGRFADASAIFVPGLLAALFVSQGSRSVTEPSAESPADE